MSFSAYTVVVEIAFGDNKNCDCSAWAACGFSNEVLMLVEIVESEDNINLKKD